MGSLCGMLWGEQVPRLTHSDSKQGAKCQAEACSGAERTGGNATSETCSLELTGSLKTMTQGRLEASGLTGPGLHSSRSAAVAERLAPPTGIYSLCLKTHWRKAVRSLGAPCSCESKQWVFWRRQNTLNSNTLPSLPLSADKKALFLRRLFRSPLRSLGSPGM